jgi:hypothetical protein
MTQGAASLSRLSAARKVSVRYLPNGALATRALASGAAAVGARHVGFGPGFVDEHKAGGINRRLARLPVLAPEGDVRPILFGRAKAFFERHALMLEKMPKSLIAHHQASVSQFLEKGAQRQVRLLGDPGEQPIPLARHEVRSAAAHPQRRRASHGAMALRPLHQARHTNHEGLATDRQD